MSSFMNGGMLPHAESLYGGSSSFNDTSTVFIDMTRDQLWKWFESHGYLRDNEYIKTLRNEQDKNV